MKKVIVAGANGFIGSELIRRLLSEDVHIWALCRVIDERLPISDRITVVEDNADLAELKTAFPIDEIDSFYNCAWQGVNGPNKARYDIQINNIMLSLRFAELAHELGCKKYLCAGTIAERAVESLPNLQKTSGGMMYSAAKACSHTMLETYCKSIGLNFVWMQFSNIYGPSNKTGNLISYTIDQLKQGKPASFGPAEQPYDFLYVDELIEAICRLGLSETTENFYYIGSGKPRILKDYLTSVGELFGRPDLICIGDRTDDGIKYGYEMLDNKATVDAVGEYVTDSFENHIKYTIDNY